MLQRGSLTASDLERFANEGYLLRLGPLTPPMVVQLLEVLEAVDEILGLGEAESPTDGGSYPHSPSLN